MHDCHSLGLIKHDTVPSFARLCIDFWIGHYNNKKREFVTRVQDIERMIMVAGAGRITA